MLLFSDLEDPISLGIIDSAGKKKEKNVGA